MHPDTPLFLDLLLARCDADRSAACLTLTAIHPDGQHPTPSRHIPLHDRDILLDTLNRLHQANSMGWGAYFAVGLRKSGLARFRRGGQTDVIALPALYADVDSPTEADLGKLRAFQPAPSILVHSGGGHHAYWLLDQPTSDLETARLVLQVLATALDGDRLSPAQSMRLPGTVNTKPARGGALCQLVEMSDRHYALLDFQQFLPPVTNKARRPLVSTSLPCLAANPIRVLNPELIRAVTEALYRDYQARAQPHREWIAALCPCGHARDSPGAHFFFNPVIGCGRCHGRHGTLPLTDLCSILGINAATYGGVYRSDEKG
jgi:hypothetical protein